ncbi:MAG: TonB-dependent receptor [Bacteroidales bacterium]|jgi:hypothetical protein|nr:TonB-dependent receptor [Bacteroidales bacterium]
MKRIILFFTLFLSLSSILWAQNGMIKGFVYDDNNGEPVAYCMIQLQGTVFGAMTEQNGSFIINKVPDGKYVLETRMFGFNSIYDTIIINKNVITKRYLLQTSNTKLDEFEVSAKGQRQVQETRTSVISVTPKEMAKMPSIGGQPDFAQYLQVLPGVISTGDQGGQLYVRGGTPIQNMLLMDGMLIYNPFHSIGLFSVFDTEIMSSADVYTGGYGAEFGGRISSVMNITTRDGNKKRVSGKVDLNTFGAKLLLEGPIVKMSEKSSTAVSYIASIKGSYLEQSSKLFYPYIGDAGLPYNYMDLYGKVSLSSEKGSKVSFFGFRFDDLVNFPEIAVYNWNNWGFGTNFLLVPGTEPTTISGSISYSKYLSGLADPNFLPKESSIDGFLANMAFNYYLGKNLLIIGFEMTGYQAYYKYFTRNGLEQNLSDYTTDIAIFGKYKFNYKDKLIIEPGFRFQYYASMSTGVPEPRLAMKYNISKSFRLKLAAGIYSQNFTTITSDRDVVSLFYGFLSSPESLKDTFDLKAMNDNLQKAQHLIFGVEYDLNNYTTFNVEAYYKNFSQLTIINRYKLFDTDPDYIWEKGNAYGGDISLKYDHKNLYIWAVYSIGWVNRNDGRLVYNPHFDRRHNINILTSYAFGKKARKTWQIDVRWNYGSGFPYSQNQAIYPHSTIGGSISGDYISENESLYYLLSDLNGGRLPSYQRMDISMKKKFFLGERNVIDLSASVTNLYNYKNIFYVDRVTSEKIYQMPILYSFGITWSF